MTNSFLNSFSSEWIKKRRSFSSSLVWAGGFFIPFIFFCINIFYPKQLLAKHKGPAFWDAIFLKSWESMSVILLPMGIILAVSLITQLEFKNNAWKQLHTTPVSFTDIFFSKLAVLLVMLIQMFVPFNIGIYLSAVLPSFLISYIPFPGYAIDIIHFVKENCIYFITALPMLALQYMISLQFKSFLVPVGVGLGILLAGLLGLKWEYAFLIPSTHPALHLVQLSRAVPPSKLVLWSLIFFVIFTLLGYALYFYKKEKG